MLRQLDMKSPLAAQSCRHKLLTFVLPSKDYPVWPFQSFPLAFARRRHCQGADATCSMMSDDTATGAQRIRYRRRTANTDSPRSVEQDSRHFRCKDTLNTAIQPSDALAMLDAPYHQKMGRQIYPRTSFNQPCQQE